MRNIQNEQKIILTHNIPKYLKFSLRGIEIIFSIQIRNFKLWEMPKLSSFRFPEGQYFLNCDNTELKRSPKNKFLFPNGIAGR